MKMFSIKTERASNMSVPSRALANKDQESSVSRIDIEDCRIRRSGLDIKLSEAEGSTTHRCSSLLLWPRTSDGAHNLKLEAGRARPEGSLDGRPL
jgi:hypothetical protein